METELAHLRLKVGILEEKLFATQQGYESDLEELSQSCCASCRIRVQRLNAHRRSANAMEMLSIIEDLDVDTTLDLMRGDLSSKDTERLAHTDDADEDSSHYRASSILLDLDPLSRFSTSLAQWREERHSAPQTAAAAVVGVSYMLAHFLFECLPSSDARSLACVNVAFRDHFETYKELGQRTNLVLAARRSEADYLRLLRVALFAYQWPMRSAAGRDADVLFESLPTFLRIHCRLYIDMCDRIGGSWTCESEIGEVFVAMGPAMRLYKNFSCNFAELNQLYSSLISKEKVRVVMREVELAHGLPPLGVILNQVYNRIDVYCDQLKSIVRVTAEDHSDLSKLIQGLRILQDIAYAVREEEPGNNRAMLFVKAVRGGVPDVVRNRVVHFEWAGLAYYSQKQSKLASRTKEKEAKVLLFRDFILIVLNSAKGWVFLASFAIGIVRVEQSGPGAITLIGSQAAPVPLLFPTNEVASFVAAKIVSLATELGRTEIDPQLEAYGPQVPLPTVPARPRKLSMPKSPRFRGKPDSAPQSPAVSPRPGAPVISPATLPFAPSEYLILLELAPDYSAVSMSFEAGATYSDVLAKGASLRRLDASKYELLDSVKSTVMVPSRLLTTNQQLRMRPM